MVAKSSRIEAVIFVTVERRCIGHMLLFCMYPIVYNADFLWHFISIDIAFIGKIRHLLCADLKKKTSTWNWSAVVYVLASLVTTLILIYSTYLKFHFDTPT